MRRRGRRNQKGRASTTTAAAKVAILLLASIVLCWYAPCEGQEPSVAPAAEPSEPAEPTAPDVSEAPVDSPTETTEAPVPSPVAASEEPSEAPVEPTAAPVEPAEPTAAPVEPVDPTAAPQATPSVSPSVSPVAATEPPAVPTIAPSPLRTFPPIPPQTIEPTHNPTVDTSPAPSSSPSDKPSSTPSAAPTLFASPAPTGLGIGVNATVLKVTTFFGNVTELTSLQVREVLSITTFWFEQSYNNDTFADSAPDTSGERRRLKKRRLQGSDPSNVGIRQMLTRLAFVDQLVEEDGVFLIYDQFLSYVEAASSQLEPDSIAKLPYAYGPTNSILSEFLSFNVAGFEGLVTPIAIPEIPPPPTPAPTSPPTPAPEEDSGGLSAGAIAGIVVACVVGVPILGYIAYLTFKGGKSGAKSVGSWWSDRQERRSASAGGGYVSAGSAPPSHVQGSGDEISRMDTKGGDGGSLGEYDPR